MPSIWTNILFSEEVIDSINNPYAKYDDFMKLGAQGPHFFSYHNFWHKNNNPLHKIGHDLYTKNYKNFIMDLILASKDQRKQVQAFVIGYVTHYVLSRNTYPYIVYYANEAECDNTKLEIMIDTLMMDKYYNLKTWKNQVYKEIDVGKHLHQDIQQLLSKTMKRYYPQVDALPSTYIQKAYRDMKLALKVFSDPYGWKSLLLKPFHSFYSYRPIKGKKDYLNLGGNTWYHPDTNKPSNKSFIELYNKSRIEGIEMVTEIENFWQEKHHFSNQTETI